MGKSDSREPSAWRIVFGMNCITPVSSVVIMTSRALVLSLKDASMAPVRLTRAAAEDNVVRVMSLKQ